MCAAYCWASAYVSLRITLARRFSEPSAARTVACPAVIRSGSTSATAVRCSRALCHTVHASRTRPASSPTSSGRPAAANSGACTAARSCTTPGWETLPAVSIGIDIPAPISSATSSQPSARASRRIITSEVRLRSLRSIFLTQSSVRPARLPSEARVMPRHSRQLRTRSPTVISAFSSGIWPPRQGCTRQRKPVTASPARSGTQVSRTGPGFSASASTTPSRKRTIYTTNRRPLCHRIRQHHIRSPDPEPDPEPALTEPGATLRGRGSLHFPVQAPQDLLGIGAYLGWNVAPLGDEFVVDQRRHGIHAGTPSRPPSAPRAGGCRVYAARTQDFAG